MKQVATPTSGTVVACATCVAGSVVLLYALRLILKGIASRGWPSSKARVVDSRVKEIATRGITYFPRITYEYRVGDDVLRSDRLRVCLVRSRNRGKAERTVETYPIGREVQAYWNPKNEKEAVLIPGVGAGPFLAGLVGLLLLSAGLAVLSGLTPQP